MTAPHTFTGIVVETRRRRFTVAVNHARGEHINVPMLGRELTPVCGDKVTLTVDTKGDAVLTAIHPRENLFYRSDAFKQKLIAANITQIIAVTAPDIAVDEMLLNRWLIAARASGCRFIIVANKKDLPTFPKLAERLFSYRQLGAITVALSAKENADALWLYVKNERSVLVGQSGMGKSTIINALIPNAGVKTAEVSEMLDGGRHTTSAATLYPLPAHIKGELYSAGAVGATGTIIDVPGMSMFGLAHLSKAALTAAFVDIAPYADLCRFRDCRHVSEPGCAVRAAMESGKIHVKRLQLFHTLLKESA